MGWVEGNLYFFGGISGYCDFNPTCCRRETVFYFSQLFARGTGLVGLLLYFVNLSVTLFASV